MAEEPFNTELKRVGERERKKKKVQVLLVNRELYTLLSNRWLIIIIIIIPGK